MQIAQDAVVLMNYTLTDDKGEKLDSSDGTPLPYLHGNGNLIPGLERELAGKSAGDMVTIDANHPLAGQNLNFDVEIVEVRAATEEELAHGHVHGPGGHHDH